MATFASFTTPDIQEPEPIVTGLRAPSVFPATAASQTGSFNQFTGGQPPTVGFRAAPIESQRTVLGTAQDVGIDLLKGFVSVPEAAVGVADIFTGGRVGKGLERVGFRPAEAKEILSEQLSPARQEAGRKFSEAEGFVAKAVTAIANPSVIASAVLESLPLMGAGGAVARGLPLLGPGARALSGITRGAIGEGVVAAGSAAEGTRQQTEDELLTGKQAALAGLSGALTGAFTLLGGRVAKELGIADVDTFLAGASQAVKKKLARRTVEGFVSEGVLEELPQSIQEQVLQNISLDRPALEGVDEAAALGLLSGGVTGAGFSATQGIQGIRGQAKDTQAATTLQSQFPDHSVTVEGGVATVTDQAGVATTLPAAQIATAALAGVPIEDILAAPAEAPPTPAQAAAVEQPLAEVPAEPDVTLAPPAEAPTVQESLATVPPAEGATREVFTVPSPALEGNTFIEDTAPDGTKTLQVVRPTGEVKSPQAGEAAIIESQERTQLTAERAEVAITPIAHTDRTQGASTAVLQSIERTPPVLNEKFLEDRATVLAGARERAGVEVLPAEAKNNEFLAAHPEAPGLRIVYEGEQALFTPEGKRTEAQFSFGAGLIAGTTFNVAVDENGVANEEHFNERYLEKLDELHNELVEMNEDGEVLSKFNKVLFDKELQEAITREVENARAEQSGTPQEVQAAAGGQQPAAVPGDRQLPGDLTGDAGARADVGQVQRAVPVTAETAPTAAADLVGAADRADIVTKLEGLFGHTQAELEAIDEGIDAGTIEEGPPGYQLANDFMADLETAASARDTEEVTALLNEISADPRNVGVGGEPAAAGDVQPGAEVPEGVATKEPVPLFTSEKVEKEPAKTLKTMSAQTKKELRKIVATGKAAVSGESLAVQTASSWLKVTPRSTLVELFKARMPLITKYDKQFDKFVAARNAEVESAGINHDIAIKAAKAGTGVDALQKAAGLGSFYQMTPWLPMNEQDWIPEGGTVADAQKAWKAAGMQKATGKGFAEAYAESAAAYNKLSKDTKEAYQVMVEDVAAIRKREKDAMQKIIEQSTEGNPTARAELLARLEDAFVGLKGAYLPLYRYGDFSLQYIDPDTGNRAVEFFTTDVARKAQLQSLKDENPEHEFEFQQTVREDLPRVTSSVPGSFMEQLTNTVRAQFVEGIDPTEERYDAKVAQAEQVIQDMTQIWLHWQPETSALKNSLQRKSTAGFSKDMLRGYLRYMQTHGGNVSFLENGRPIEDTLEEIAGSIKEQKEEGVDVSLDQSVLTDLRNRYAATRDVSVGGFASAVSRLGTFWYMTSPSIFLVQLSQIGVLTFPQLATNYSIRKASKALTRSMGQAFSTKFTRKAMMDDVVVQTVYEDIMATVTPEDRALPQWKDAELGSAKFNQGELLSSIRALDPYQKQLLALRVSMARNVLDISLTHEVNELVRGKDPNSATAKALKASMLFMRHGELASRKAAVLATFELAQDAGKNFFESMDEVVAVAKNTLYDYSREGKGVLLQGDIARVVMQFQHFRIMSMFKLGLLAKDTIGGDRDALRELTGIMGMSALLSGAMGIPLSGLTFQMLSSLFGSDDEPYDAELEFTNWLRDNFGELGARTTAHGLPALLGLNLSRRIGLSDVTAVPGTEAPEYLHGDGLAAYYASQLLGPSYSVPSGWFKAYDDIVNKGDIGRGLEAATPKPIRDILKAWRVAHEGLKTRAGKKLLKDEEIGANDLFMMGLGFLPEDVSWAQEKSRKTAAIGGKISARRGRLMRDIVKDIENGDDLTDSVDAIRTFNTKSPAYAVTSGEIRSAYRARARGEAGIPSRREALIRQDFGIE